MFDVSKKNMLFCMNNNKFTSCCEETECQHTKHTNQCLIVAKGLTLLAFPLSGEHFTNKRKLPKLKWQKKSSDSKIKDTNDEDTNEHDDGKHEDDDKHGDDDKHEDDDNDDENDDDNNNQTTDDENDGKNCGKRGPFAIGFFSFFGSDPP